MVGTKTTMSTRTKEEEQKLNGFLARILQFGQLVVLGCVLPWGVWVTGQIYGLSATVAQHSQWQISREKAQVATITDVDVTRFKVKDELLAVLTPKIDILIKEVSDLKTELLRHEAATSNKP